MGISDSVQRSNTTNRGCWGASKAPHEGLGYQQMTVLRFLSSAGSGCPEADVIALDTCTRHFLGSGIMEGLTSANHTE